MQATIRVFENNMYYLLEWTTVQQHKLPIILKAQLNQRHQWEFTTLVEKYTTSW